MHDNRELDLEGWSLYRAAEENRTDIARALINRGDDVDSRDESNATPLFAAAFSNSPPGGDIANREWR